MESSRQFCLNEYANNFIRHKARQLIGKYGFTRDDYEDLKQELALDLLMRLSKFDASKSSLNTFVTLIVNRKAASLIRFQRREKRDQQREAFSLDGPLNSGDRPRRRDLTSEEERDPTEQHDLRLDVSLVVTSLPADLQLVARLLQAHSVAETARALGVPRGTLYGTGVARLRKAFEGKRLTDYL